MVQTNKVSSFIDNFRRRLKVHLGNIQMTQRDGFLKTQKV